MADCSGVMGVETRRLVRKLMQLFRQIKVGGLRIVTSEIVRSKWVLDLL